MIYAGVDVHVRNSYLHISDAAGQVLRKGRCLNTPAELAAFLEDFEGEQMLVCLESTTNSRAVHRMVLEAGRRNGVDVQAQVLHARKLRVIAESTCKCDRLDAAVINEVSRSNFKLPICYLPDDEEFALREHLRARADLVRMRTMLKNRVHALLHRRGIVTPRGDLFTAQSRVFLEQVTMDEAGREILERFLGQIDRIGAEIDASTRSLRELSRRPRWAKPAALLQSMPGIGLITALTILAELGDLSRFRSRAALSNYAGLVPVVRDSNDKRYRGSIRRGGPIHLRAILIESAWIAAARVPVYRVLFERIAAKKDKRTAIVAVARRMLEDAFVMLRKQQPFRYVPAGSARGAQLQGASSVAG
jgi:transposase